MKPRSIIGYTLGALGVLIVVATLAFHFWLHVARPGEAHEFLYFPTVAGAVIGWWGFFWADSKRSLEGGGFLVSAAERLRLARAGRRDTDPVVAVPVPVAASASDGVAAPAAPAQPVAPVLPPGGP
jgi:hypothetical protein